MKSNGKAVLLRIIGGVVFAAGIYFFVFPEIGKTATIGLLLAFVGYNLAVKAS